MPRSSRHHRPLMVNGRLSCAVLMQKLPAVVRIDHQAFCGWRCRKPPNCLQSNRSAILPVGAGVPDKREGSMRSLCIFGLMLVISCPPAHSRGFAWFFAHSKPAGNCSGQQVVATYYVSGRRTASGQAFASGELTAAHRTLPFGSHVTVTNPQNGSSVTVVINDRGPFTHGVTLDLSAGAARAIGMHGTQWVCML
jgi:hypothetical protein